MIYAARQTPPLASLQMVRPIRFPISSNAVDFMGIRRSCSTLVFVQVALYIGIMATLAVQMIICTTTNEPAIYVNAQVLDGVALIILNDDAQKIAEENPSAPKWLDKGDSFLVKEGDRIEALGGAVLLTYFDGSVRQISQTAFTVPALDDALPRGGFSLSEWFERILLGLHRSFEQNVTVASVLG
ncbi:MAG: hypothetical protein R2911_17120 [Caldilineaceae bacterium]